MKGEYIAVGIILGFVGFVVLSIGIEGTSQYETWAGEFTRAVDPEAQANYEIYLLMEAGGFIMIIIGGILIIAGLIANDQPQLQPQYHYYYSQPQPQRVYHCPDCRNEVTYIQQYQKYYCYSCNDYPFDRSPEERKKIKPEVIKVKQKKIKDYSPNEEDVDWSDIR